MVEWWSAEDSSVLHAREITRSGRGFSAVCRRALRWTKQIEDAKLTTRCGYCSYHVRIAGGNSWLR